jgi:hypothetical protein
MKFWRELADIVSVVSAIDAKQKFLEIAQCSNKFALPLLILAAQDEVKVALRFIPAH